jgi:hypothetical protein
MKEEFEQTFNGPIIHIQLDGKMLAQIMAEHPEMNLLAMMKAQKERERERRILLDMAYRNCEE